MTNESMTNLLLQWYEKNGRDLPWRVKGGPHPDPYVILVSEFMLQQTGVKTVIPYFQRFMQRFPTVQSLAAADREEVYLYWQGLGYYTRAKSLHTSARLIVENYNGTFPDRREDILSLKGIGEYTVASFLSLAFNQPETVIDGNVSRIICRLYRLTAPLPTLAAEIRTRAAALTDKEHPADYASAIMDLGALICPPKKPQCLLCPWQSFCLSCGAADVEQIPQRLKNVKKEKHGSVYLIRNPQGRLFIRKRSEKGLLSGLYEFPWTDNGTLYPEALPAGKEITHIFTHFRLTLKIYTLLSATAPQPDGIFVTEEELSAYPLSTLMKKVLAQMQP